MTQKEKTKDKSPISILSPTLALSTNEALDTQESKAINNNAAKK